MMMMMTKAAKLGWEGAGAGKEQESSKAGVGQKQEQCRSKDMDHEVKIYKRGILYISRELKCAKATY